MLDHYFNVVKLQQDTIVSNCAEIMINNDFGQGIHYYSHLSLLSNYGLLHIPDILFTVFCLHRSVAVLTECMRNKALAKFFRERQESLSHSLPLGSYLLKPVQRILKYHLLLHVRLLLKHTHINNYSFPTEMLVQATTCK